MFRHLFYFLQTELKTHNLSLFYLLLLATFLTGSWPRTALSQIKCANIFEGQSKGRLSRETHSRILRPVPDNYIPEKTLQHSEILKVANKLLDPFEVQFKSMGSSSPIGKITPGKVGESLQAEVGPAKILIFPIRVKLFTYTFAVAFMSMVALKPNKV